MAEQRRYLSTVQVAEILGVGATTVKRWVDEGRLPAHRTAGGHRKILASDVQRLVQSGGYPCANPALLASCAGEAAPSVTELTDHLYEALLAADHAQARSLVLGAHAGGLSMDRLADEVVAPTMARVGHGWERNTLDVYQEHQGAQVCLTALQALKAKLNSSNGHERPLAIGGGPEGDHYLLANLLVELVLVELGWKVVNIGPNTPLPSFARALGVLRPRLMWLSCSYLIDEEMFVRGWAPCTRRRFGSACPSAWAAGRWAPRCASE